ncbi:MAG: hypothetical protein HZA14_12470 [Nitrospirae bacterium]|nr:hypothetical protein [Nitrospirota bacterium]
MKFKIILICILILLISIQAAIAIAPTILLSAVTSTGAGIGKTVKETFKDWTCQVNITGSPTIVTVGLEGNLDGTIYTSMDTYIFTAADLSAGQGVFSIIGQPANSIRGNLITFTGGTSPTLTMICVGVN